MFNHAQLNFFYQAPQGHRGFEDVDVGSRTWYHMPQVGETIQFSPGRNLPDIYGKIVSVVHMRDTHESRQFRYQIVNVYMTKDYQEYE